MKIVITGPSCSGKTSIINALCELGYSVVPEAAREVIKKNKELGSKALPWDDFYTFELEILNKQLSQLKDIDDGDMVFFDRGIYDTIGFLIYKGFDAPHLNVEYDLVFYLEPLNSYHNDGERWEDKDTALQIGELIRNEYLKRGFKVIDLPAYSDNKEESIKMRVQAIIDAIKEHAKTL